MEEPRKRHKKLWVITGVLLVLLFCIFFFRVKRVTIEGNTYYSQTDMAERFQSNILQRNVLSFWLLDKCSLTPNLPFVREYAGCRRRAGGS